MLGQNIYLYVLQNVCDFCNITRTIVILEKLLKTGSDVFIGSPTLTPSVIHEHLS